MIITLNDNWKMSKHGENNPEYNCGSLPVSMYCALLKNGVIENPYRKENEYVYRDLSRDDYDFFTVFAVGESVLAHDRVYLRFLGVDTISEIYLNDKLICATDNMFRAYDADVKGVLRCGENTLSVSVKSPLVYIEDKQAERPVWGVFSTIDGYPHIRKAHYMFGWDWGPKLPDMGIWRGVKLVTADVAEVESFYARQRFNEDYSRLTLTIEAEISHLAAQSVEAVAEVRLSDGRELTERITDGKAVFCIDNPPLWYVRGYGEQTLNDITVKVYANRELVSEKSETIGFRTLTVNNSPEEHKFCFVCNGLEIFAMGADFIPLDQLLPNITDEKTAALIAQFTAANYNSLRIWGGGYYPDDMLLSECDRLGIVLWQDFMFACSVYKLSPRFEETISAELEYNIKRLRNHACVGLWCGNNEIESMWEGWGVKDEECKADYVRIFEEIVPNAVKKYDPDRFYWPSSPSSGGNQFGENGCFRGSSDKDRGDQHYWEIWHSFKPLEEFRKYLFPFCSEYGFESIPCMKTIRSFADENDLNLCSPVMEAHQKCDHGNEKLLYYIAQMCRYPYTFEKLIYASQLVQSDAIRSDVEHMRRNRGRCMGSMYWQVNDTNPVISWSSIDYYNRWKALHYAARRFYAPVLLSCLEEDVSAVVLNVSNEQLCAVSGELRWAVRNNCAEVITSGAVVVRAEPLSSKNAVILDLSAYFSDDLQKRSNFLEYSFTVGGNTISGGTTLFVRPKAFNFINPEINCVITDCGDRFTLCLNSAVYAKSVCLDFTGCDCVFSDNWFDICGSEVTVEINKNTLSEPMTAEQLSAQLTVMSCYELQ